MKKRGHKEELLFISFRKEGQKTVNPKPSGLLTSAKDWEMNVRLQKQLVFPSGIVATNLRLHIVLWSPTRKRVILIELTVLREERLKEEEEI